MAPLLARNQRRSPVVEILEGRRLLSQFGRPSGWDGSAREIANPAEMSAPNGGPRDPGGDHGAGSGFGNSPGLGSAPAGDQGHGDPSGVGRPGNDRGSVTTANDASSMPGNGCPSPTTSGTSAGGPGGSTSSGSNANLSSPVTPANPDRAEAATSFGSPSSGPVSPAPGVSTSPNSIAPASPGNSPPRAEFPGSIGRSSGVVSPTSRVIVEAAGPSSAPENAGRPSAGEAASAIPAPLTVGSDLAINISSPRGSSTLEILGGPGSPGGQDRPALALGASKSGLDARSPVDDPTGANWEAGEGEVQAGRGEAVLVSSGEGLEAPDPHLADMILNFLPFDRSTLDEAIDQFLDPFDGMVSSMPTLRGPLGLVTASLAVAVTVLAAEAAIRIRRSKDEGFDADAVEGLVAFPGLPRLRRWSRS